jgi:hypothetical protein
MTYTYKLARRLAISRKSGLSAACALLAACGGDTTAPEAPAVLSTPSAPYVPPTPPVPLGFNVLPSAVTVEVDQSVRFRAELRSGHAGLRMPSLRWETSGGTITSDGLFVASRPGTYRVIGRSRIHRPDTSVVIVVPRQPTVERIRVSPQTLRIVRGRKRTFTAVGRLPDGTHTAIRVHWSSTGGTISRAGVYLAGDTPGTYRVIARSLRGGHADTIPVVIRRGRQEREAAASRIILRPSSATLASRSSLQFAAFGRAEDGDSIAVDVTFEATGGTVTETGLYTAGRTPGTYRVIASAGHLADTSVITLASTSGGGTPGPAPSPVPEPNPAPEPSPAPQPGPMPDPTSGGVPFGHFKEPAPGSPLRTGGDLVVPMGELDKLQLTKARGGQVIVNVVGGGKCSLDASGQWRMDLWQACWRRNLPSALRTKMLAYADSGVVVGTYLIDEPNLVKRWGNISRAEVCEMAHFARTELPGIPVIVRAAPSWLGECAAIDAGWAQYGSRRGVSVEAYREEHLAAARALGYGLVVSLNALNDDGSGTDMTPAQVKDYGTSLMVPGICLFFVWEYNVAWSERPEIRTALDSLARIAATLPRRSCARRG